MSHSLHLVGLNNIYDYDIASLKADIESLSGSLSRLEYEIEMIKISDPTT